MERYQLFFLCLSMGTGHASTRTNMHAYAATAHMLVQDDPQCEGYFACRVRTPLRLAGHPQAVEQLNLPLQVWNRGKEQGMAQGNL